MNEILGDDREAVWPIVSIGYKDDKHWWMRWTSPPPDSAYYWLSPETGEWVGEPHQQTMPDFPTRQAAVDAFNATPHLPPGFVPTERYPRPLTWINDDKTKAHCQAHTPMLPGFDRLTSDEGIIRALIRMIGEDPDRPGLRETPARVVKAWKFWTQGYTEDPAKVLKVFEDGAENCDEMVIQEDIPVYSMCEHHLCPFVGVAHIAYIPDGRIVGLSKLVRLTDIFAQRLQVQERLTNQIADALMEHLKPLGVGVVVQCRHMCMESRGVRVHGTRTKTSALRGVFIEKPEVRSEFMSLMRGRR